MYNKIWNRKKVIDFCNSEIFSNIHFKCWAGINGELFDVVKLVEEYRRTNNYPQEMTARVDNGFLFINDKPVGRIARKMPEIPFDKGAYYWEGRILARQERMEA